MKKSLLAVAAMTAFAGAAQAQSSVSVYGIMDAGYASVSNTTTAGGKTTGLQSGGLASPRLGFMGKEDLGGGTQANFVLEAEVLTANGQADGNYASTGNGTAATQSTGFFNRASYVGLSNVKYGEIKLGLSNTATYDNQIKFDPLHAANLGGFLNTSTMQASTFTGPVIASSTTANSATYGQQNGANRGNNAISYTSPMLYGFQARFLTGEAQGTTGMNNYAGIPAYLRVTDYGLSYNWRALDLAATYRTTSGTTIGLQPISASGNATSTSTTGLYGSYDFQIVKPYLIYNITANKTPGVSQGYNVIAKMVGVEAPITPTITVAAQYTQNINGNVGTSSLSGTSSAEGLMAKYALSKRTSLYVLGAFSQNGGAGAFLTSTSKFTGATAPVVLTGTSGYSNQTGYMLGMNHTF
jgi:predicted porin